MRRKLFLFAAVAMLCCAMAGWLQAAPGGATKAKTNDPAVAIKSQMATLEAECQRLVEANDEVGLENAVAKLDAARQTYRELLGIPEPPRTPRDALDAVGDDCTNPIVITIPGQLNYTESNTTCGRHNDYTGGCLLGWGNAEDAIYRLVVTQQITMTITVTSAGGYEKPGWALDPICPPPTGCFHYVWSFGGVATATVTVNAGTYYLWVDNNVAPNCMAYTLTITNNSSNIGRCCYGSFSNPTCANNTLSQCNALSGLWTSGLNCTNNPCPSYAAGEICETAIPLAVPGTVTGSTCSFQDNYDAGCPFNTTSPDVVYSWAPATDQRMAFSLCRSGYDTKIFVYRDNCIGSPIACNDDGNPCPGSTGYYRSYLPCMLYPTGHTYYIVVDGGTTLCGDYVLESISCQPCLDNCSGQPDTHCNITGGAIADNTVSTFPLTVPVQYHITRVRVCLDLDHTYDAEVGIDLQSPTGTSVRLSELLRQLRAELHLHALRRSGNHSDFAGVAAVYRCVHPRSALVGVQWSERRG